MRKGFEGLYGLVRDQLRADPLSGHLFLFSNRTRTRLKALVWDGSGLWVTLGPVDVVRFAEAFGAKGLKIEGPEEISSTLKKALAMPGPVIVGVPVDYRDNHRLMENVHPDALN
jgi:hypothetical protein